MIAFIAVELPKAEDRAGDAGRVPVLLEEGQALLVIRPGSGPIPFVPREGGRLGERGGPHGRGSPRRPGQHALEPAPALGEVPAHHAKRGEGGGQTEPVDGTRRGG